MDKFTLYLFILGYIHITRTRNPSDIVNDTKKNVVSTMSRKTSAMTTPRTISKTMMIRNAIKSFSFLGIIWDLFSGIGGNVSVSEFCFHCTTTTNALGLDRSAGNMDNSTHYIYLSVSVFHFNFFNFIFRSKPKHH